MSKYEETLRIDMANELYYQLICLRRELMAREFFNEIQKVLGELND